MEGLPVCARTRISNLVRSIDSGIAWATQLPISTSSVKIGTRRTGCQLYVSYAVIMNITPVLSHKCLSTLYWGNLGLCNIYISNGNVYCLGNRWNNVFIGNDYVLGMQVPKIAHLPVDFNWSEATFRSCHLIVWPVQKLEIVVTIAFFLTYFFPFSIIDHCGNNDNDCHSDV